MADAIQLPALLISWRCSMLIQFKVLIAALLFLTLSLGAAAATEPSPPDLSFTEEEANSSGFVRPPLQPERIGDMEYLRSLPRAKLPVYERGVGSVACTNSLEIVRVTLTNKQGQKAVFSIPKAYLDNRNMWSEEGRAKLKTIPFNVLLPDFRPACLRDRLTKLETERELVPQGLGDYSGLSGTISFGSKAPLIEDPVSIRLEAFRERYTADLGELIPGLQAYGPDRSIKRQALYDGPLYLVPTEETLRKKYLFECPTKYRSNEIYGACRITFRMGNGIRFRTFIRGYMEDWKSVTHHMSSLIGTWIKRVY
jgi:hypothetical protein